MVSFFLVCKGLIPNSQQFSQLLLIIPISLYSIHVKLFQNILSKAFHPYYHPQDSVIQKQHLITLYKNVVVFCAILKAPSYRRIQLKIIRMDLEWLLPQQIDQILRFCQLSSVEDLTLAANILQNHQWDIEKAMHDVVGQNDQMTKNQQNKKQIEEKKLLPKHEVIDVDQDRGMLAEEGFQLDPRDYSQLDQANSSVPAHNLNHPTSNSTHSALLAQQNFQYEEIQRKMIERSKLQAQMELYDQQREKEYNEGKKQFQDRVCEDPMAIKFRMSHKTEQFTFSKQQKVATLFKYVGCCLRDGFEGRHSEFDLNQAFPAMSLKEKKELTLAELFGDSTGEVLMVREC